MIGRQLAQRGAPRDFGQRGNFEIVGEQFAVGVGEAHAPQAGHVGLLDLRHHAVGRRGDAADFALADGAGNQSLLVVGEFGEVEQLARRVRLLAFQRRDDFRQHFAHARAGAGQRLALAGGEQGNTFARLLLDADRQDGHGLVDALGRDPESGFHVSLPDA